MTQKPQRRDLRRLAMGLSLAAAVLMLGGKLSAYSITNSAAIFSDAAESLVHGIATGIAAFSLWFSHRGAGEKFPYGPGKIAYFSAGFEGALILTTGVYVIYSGVHDLIFGVHLSQLGLGLAITFVLAMVNLALGTFLVSVGKVNNDLILTANGKHVLTDMWTSIGVVLGVGVVWLTGYGPLDPIIAIIIGINVVYSSAKLVKSAMFGLLDAADPKKTERLLKALDDALTREVISGYHQLRHRESNDIMWIQIHMLLPGELSTAESHRRVTLVEDELTHLFPEMKVHITSHIEPEHHDGDHPEGHPGLGDPFAQGESGKVQPSGQSEGQ